MNEKSKTQVTMPTDEEIVVTRTFDAPRSLVWEVWTQAKHLKEWWGPKGWTLPVCDVDFRIGGTWFYCMKGPDDMMACGKATYSEIHEPEGFVMKDSFVDTEGNPLQGMPVAVVTLRFIAEGNRTTVISQSVYPSKADRDRVIEMGVEEGITETQDRLESYLRTVGT
ncbi:MAG: SRPBCC domain-containing protein [Candidatus Promineifilaceae bacterium]|nr:SRPBCC domain-containing protein [Candidatus Promineifilaceae bacterium]